MYKIIVNENINIFQKPFWSTMTHFFPMSHSDPPENIRKPQKTFVFLLFSGGSKGKNWEEMG